MVRMQSDARLPSADRLGYKHIGDALFRIAKDEGVRTYWRGATPTGRLKEGIGNSIYRESKIYDSCGRDNYE